MSKPLSGDTRTSSSTCLPATQDVGTESDPSETRQPVCGTFVRGTMTGRVLTCGYGVGHFGGREGELAHLSVAPQRRLRRGVQRDLVEPGAVYIGAPNKHLLVNPDRVFALSQTELVHFVRPSDGMDCNITSWDPSLR